MALQLRRGTNAERLAITPAIGELIYVTNATAAGVPALWVGDGSTLGGYPAGDALSTLSDVVITGTPSDQVPLTYDTATGKWGNLKGLSVYGENTNPTSNSNYLAFYGEYIGSGSVDIGWGAGLQFNLENTAGSIVADAGEFIVAMTDKTLGAESYKISLEVTHGGVPSIKALETSKTDTKIAGNLTINDDQDSASSIIYAKTSGADSTLTWDGSTWGFANPIKLNGSSSGSITLSAGATPAVQTYTLPSAYPGVNGYYLSSTTGGTLSWVAPGIDSSSDSITVSGSAISLLTRSTYMYTSSGTGTDTATLAAGTNGQLKSLVLFDDSGYDMQVTVTNAGWKGSGTGTITFNDIGDSVTLHYINNKWFAVGTNGVTYA